MSSTVQDVSAAGEFAVAMFKLITESTTRSNASVTLADRLGNPFFVLSSILANAISSILANLLLARHPYRCERPCPRARKFFFFGIFKGTLFYV